MHVLTCHAFIAVSEYLRVGVADSCGNPNYQPKVPKQKCSNAQRKSVSQTGGDFLLGKKQHHQLQPNVIDGSYMLEHKHGATNVISGIYMLVSILFFVHPHQGTWILTASRTLTLRIKVL